MSSNDLVTRLRSAHIVGVQQLCSQAADEIERQERLLIEATQRIGQQNAELNKAHAEIERLRAGLKELATNDGLYNNRALRTASEILAGSQVEEPAFVSEERLTINDLGWLIAAHEAFEEYSPFKVETSRALRELYSLRSSGETFGEPHGD